MRRLAILFLKATARGPLREALEAGESAGGGAAVGRRGGSTLLSGVLRALGRFGGLFLTARAKVAIQEWLINRYRIPVEWQPREELRRRLVGAFATVAAEAGGEEPPGDYLEFGVYQGNSLICAHAALAETGLDSVRLFGFDSFEGLPQPTVDAGIWSRGQFRSDYEFTLERLRAARVDLEHTHLVRGFYDETLTAEIYERLGLERAAVVLFDCDLYSSTARALAFCRPLIQGWAFLLFDDFYSTDETRGEQRALREFRQKFPELAFEELGGWSARSQSYLVREQQVAAVRPGRGAA